MIGTPTFAAVVADRPDLLVAAEFATIGILVVLGTLFLMTVLLYASGAVFRRVGRDAQNRAIRAPEQAIPEPPTGIEPQIVAAIAAAVQATVIAPHRVVTIRALPTEGANWLAEGRRQLLTSHKLR